MTKAIILTAHEIRLRLDRAVYSLRRFRWKLQCTCCACDRCSTVERWCSFVSRMFIWHLFVLSRNVSASYIIIRTRCWDPCNWCQSRNKFAALASKAAKSGLLSLPQQSPSLHWPRNEICSSDSMLCFDPPMLVHHQQVSLVALGNAFAFA